MPKTFKFEHTSCKMTIQKKIQSMLPSIVAAIFCGLLLCPVFGEASQVSKDVAPPQEDNGKEFLIGMGDVLEISVWNEPDLSKTVFVRLDGRISLPLVGDVIAANKSPQSLSQILKEQFGKFVEDPSVSVILETAKSKRYYIVGQIARPGEFIIDYPITVLQAIARSGGFLEWAKKSKILIVRQEGGEEKILTFDYDFLLKEVGLDQNIQIVPGDTIIIP